MTDNAHNDGQDNATMNNDPLDDDTGEAKVTNSAAAIGSADQDGEAAAANATTNEAHHNGDVGPADLKGAESTKPQSGEDPYAAFRRHTETANDEATGFVPAVPNSSDSGANTHTEPPKPLFSTDSLPDMSEQHANQSFGGDDEDSSHAEFTTVYDIIDTMQQTLDEAKAGLFTPGIVKIDKHEFSNSIVELKKMLPVQLERASALMRESERRLQNARTQANAIISSAQSRAADTVREAKEQAQFLAGQENVVAIAEQKAKVILDTARTKASTLSEGADRYSIRVMNDLDEQLNKIQQDVQAGLRVLDERQQKAQQQSQGEH